LKNARSSSKRLIFKPISRILVTIRRSTRTIDSWRRTQVRTSVYRRPYSTMQAEA
jgi:hypothetical protein